MEPTSGVWASLRLGQAWACIWQQVESHSRARHFYNTGLLTTIAYRWSVPGALYWCVLLPVAVCCTYGLSFFFCVSLSLHDLRSIVKLRLIDTSTTVILHVATTHPCSDNTTLHTTYPYRVCLAKIFADAKQDCLIVKNSLNGVRLA